MSPQHPSGMVVARVVEAIGKCMVGSSLEEQALEASHHAEMVEALESDIRFFESIANHEQWEATGIGNLCRGYALRRRDLLTKNGEPHDSR